MRYITNPLIALLVITTKSFSQSEATPDIRDVTKLTILSPGFSAEKRIGKFQSLNAQAYMHLSAYYGYSSTFGTTSGVNFDPAIEIGYRYYYNVGRRFARGKRIEMNSANYVGATHQSVIEKRLAYDAALSKSRYRLLNGIGVVWGIQRNYPKRFSLDVQV